MIRELVEKCKKKGETDGGYGDLGVIPTAPSNLGKDKDKDKMIVDGEFREEEKDKSKEK